MKEIDRKLFKIGKIGVIISGLVFSIESMPFLKNSYFYHINEYIIIGLIGLVIFYPIIALCISIYYSLRYRGYFGNSKSYLPIYQRPDNIEKLKIIVVGLAFIFIPLFIINLLDWKALELMSWILYLMGALVLISGLLYFREMITITAGKIKIDKQRIEIDFKDLQEVKILKSGELNLMTKIDEVKINFTNSEKEVINFWEQWGKIIKENKNTLPNIS